MHCDSDESKGGYEASASLSQNANKNNTFFD